MTRQRSPFGSRSLFTVSAITLLILQGISFSQEFPEPPGFMELMRANEYAEHGDYQEAVKILLELIKEDPANLAAFERLKEVYADAKEYDKAVEVVGEVEKRFGESSRTYLWYGDLYLKAGSREKARDYLAKALDRNPSDATIYPRVAEVYRSNGIYEAAIETYLNAQTRFKDQTLFSLELGKLYEISRSYDKAAHQYYTYMTSDTSHAVNGERLIQRLIEYVDDPDDIIELKKAFSDLVSSEPGSYIPRHYLADILIRQDSLERAYELYQRIDRLAEGRGKYLVHFARRCLELGSPEIATRACRYALEEYPNEPFQIQARYVVASAHISMGHADSAVAVLMEVLESIPEPRGRLEANYEIGEIYLLWLRIPDSAMAHFDEVIRGTEKSGWHYRALLRKADCYLVKGDLITADSLYSGTEMQLLPGQDQEYLLWMRAQVKFFGHEFDDAKRLYADLTVNFRKGLFVNDCLRKMLMITENTGFDQYDLGTLADAEYLMTRNVYDSAETKLISLSEKSGSNLADISTYGLGELYVTLQQPDKAISTFQKILDRFQDSFWRGEAQKQIADIYLAQGEVKKAQEAYLELLTDYDSVLLQEHAREKLKQLDNPQL